MPVEDYLDSLNNYTDPLNRRRSRRPLQSEYDLSPEDQRSLLGRIGGTAVSGLSAGANVLDLIGSVPRDIVAGAATGNWSKYNPLDQFLDPFGKQADQNRVTGRDLNQVLGMSGSRKNWGNWLGGAATEIGLDPLTYLTLGASAVAKGSKAAAKGLPLAEQIAKGHRGLVGLRAPFSDSVLKLGTGKASQKVARGIDTVSEAIKYGNIPGTEFSPGRLASRLFDAEVGGTKTKDVQKLAKGLAGERTAQVAAGRLFSAAKARELIDAGLTTPENGDALRRALEGTGRIGDFKPSEMGKVSKFVDETIAENQRLLQEAKSIGMDVEAFQDSTNLKYFQRYLSAEGGSNMWKKRVLDTTDKSQIGREWYMRDIEGGTDAIQRIAKDPDIEKLIAAKAKPAAIRDAITAKYGDVFKGAFKDVEVDVSKIPLTAVVGDVVKIDGKTGILKGVSGTKATLDVAEKTPLQHGTRFVESLMGMKPETRAAGVFGNHPVADMMHGMTSRRDAITVSKGITEFLQEPGRLLDYVEPGSMPVDDFMKSLKLSGSPLVGQGKHISGELAADIKRLHEGFTNPESVNEVIKGIDSATNLFKAGVTGLWPAFHTRNLTSGQWQNWISGMFDVGSVKDAGGLLQGKTVKDAHLIPAVADELSRRGLAATPESGTKVLGDLAFAHELIGKFEGQAVDVAGMGGKQVAHTLDDLTSAIPGLRPTKSLAGTAFDLPTFAGKGGSINPLKVRGVGDQEVSKFGPAKWGENLGHYVEGLNRVAPFINQLRKGVDPATAALKVGAAQVMYCVDDQTEVLTDSGWKLWHEVSGDDQALTLDLETNSIQWHDFEMNVFGFVGQLYEWTQDRPKFSAMTTSGHRWPVSAGRFTNALEFATSGATGHVRMEHEAAAPKPTSHQFKDMEGKELKKLTVGAYVGADIRGEARWNVTCECGSEFVSRGSSLRNGGTTSCGCSRGDGKRHKWMTTEQISHGIQKHMIVSGGLLSTPFNPTHEDELVELVGWYITEGSTHCNEGITISQSEKHNPQFAKEIERLRKYFSANDCTATEFSPLLTKWGTIRVFYFGLGIGRRVMDLCPEKQLTPSFLQSLTRDQLELLYDVLLKGDGSKRDATTNKISGIKRGTLSQKDQGRCDSFQMLCAMLGRRSTQYTSEDGYSNLSAISQPRITTSNLAVRRVAYDGVVWCPTTPTGTWMARRRGTTYWTGNSGKHYTPFEREVLARVVPFYKFSSRQLPFQLRVLADQPGGKLAQTLRAIERGRNPDELTPDYVSETAAIPLGKKDDGTSRFLTGFGLPVEDTAAFLTPSARGIGLEALSRMNPLVKAPLEYMTGQTFFQKGPSGGRPLEDLDPTIGRTIANIKEQLGGEKERYAKPFGGDSLEFALANSPLSRILTTARTLSDPRKGTGAKATNLLTGFRINDVSPASQDAILREAAAEAMKRLGGKTFTRTFIPSDRKEKLSEQDQMDALMLDSLMKELARRTKERKAAK